MALPIDFSSIGYDLKLTAATDTTIVGLVATWKDLTPCKNNLLVLSDAAGRGALVSHFPVVRPSYIHIDGGHRYTIERHLKTGGYGMVAACRGPGGRRYILKVIECDRTTDAQTAEQKASVLTEIMIQHILGAPVIHRVARNRNTLFLLMEFMEGQDELAFIQSRPTNGEWATEVKDCLRAGVGLSKGLYAHFEFIHGDLKPDNMFHTDDGQIIFIDFGFANMVVGEATELVANERFARARHPTRDITMLAVALRSLLRHRGVVYERVRGIIDAILDGAMCDTTSDETLRGQLEPHAPHPIDPKNTAWADMYALMNNHNNAQAMAVLR